MLIHSNCQITEIQQQDNHIWLVDFLWVSLGILLCCFGILLRLRGNVFNLWCPLRPNGGNGFKLLECSEGCAGTSLNQEMWKIEFEWVSDFTGQSVFDQWFSSGMGGLEGLVRLLGSQEMHDTSQTINNTTNSAFRWQSLVVLKILWLASPSLCRFQRQ